MRREGGVAFCRVTETRYACHLLPVRVSCPLAFYRYRPLPVSAPMALVPFLIRPAPLYEIIPKVHPY